MKKVIFVLAMLVGFSAHASGKDEVANEYRTLQAEYQDTDLEMTYVISKMELEAKRIRVDFEYKLTKLKNRMEAIERDGSNAIRPSE